MALPDIANRFAYHPANDFTAPQHAAVRTLCGDVAEVFEETLPEGRHKALALTALQEAMMWANAAIACDSPRP